MAHRRYDIFISYRRDGGAETAKLLRDTLTERGYKVFLDVESLRSGPFNEALYKVIETSNDIVLILPKDSLDRCVDEQDWVRKEIEHAKACGKNIVPIMLRGFAFPPELPESLEFLRFQNGISANMEYYDAFVDNIEEFLTARRHITRRMRVPVYLACALALIAAIGLGAYHVTRYPRNTEQRNLVNGLVSFMVSDLKKMDLAADRYQKELDKVERYLGGVSRMSEDGMCQDALTAAKDIRGYMDEVTEMPVSLHDSLADSPFNVGDLDAFAESLLVIMDDYAEKLELLGNDMIKADLSDEHGVELVDAYKEMAELDCELVFYNINDTLMPVNVDSALEPLLRTYMPDMVRINEKRLDFTDDAAVLKGKMDAVWQQYESVMDSLRDNSWSEREYISRQQMDDVEALREDVERTTDENSAEGQQAREHVDELEQEVAADAAATDAQIAWERYAPKAKDDLDTIWEKGVKFLDLGMPEDAAECFEYYAERCPEDEVPGAEAARMFADAYAGLAAQDITGGVVVVSYEKGKPHQALEVADVIYALDGTTVEGTSDYEKAWGKAPSTASVVRFSKDGTFELTEATVDATKGGLVTKGLAHSAIDG